MERPTLRQLEYAVAVADHRHFGRAADSLHVSQPGLSSQIRELERRLGVPIFERAARQVELTAAGTEVVDRARQVLRAVNELTVGASMHSGTVRGRLRLGAIPTIGPYLLAPVTRALRTEWPEAQLVLQELQTRRLVEATEQGELDVGLLAVPVETGALHVEPVGAEEFVLALADDHRLAADDEVAPSVLSELRLLLLEDGHCLRDHVLAACDIAGPSDRRELHGASLSALTQMVAAGQGVTLLPASAVPIEARKGSGISVRRFSQPGPGRGIALVWRRSDPRADLYTTLAARLAEALDPMLRSGGAVAGNRS